MMINTDRSRIEARQKCARLAFLQYEYALQGLDLDDSAVALNIGSAVHKAPEAVLPHLSGADRRGSADLYFLALQAATSCKEFAALESQDDRDLVEALVRTWWFAGLPLLTGWQIMSVEQEETYTPPPQLWMDSRLGNDTVRLMSRSDWIARAIDGLVLNGLPVAPGLYNWNLKSWRDCGERRRKSMLYDAQVFTELFGPEARLQSLCTQCQHLLLEHDLTLKCANCLKCGCTITLEEVNAIRSTRFAGVIYQVLVKEDHPLVWAWRSSKTGELVGRYRWTCATAHENTHTKAGGWCPGGKLHRLGGEYERVAVRDAVEGGQAAWFERLCETDPDLLREFHVILGPKMRASDYEMEEWLETWLPHEAQINRQARYIEACRLEGATEHYERALREFFPKETAHGNCIYPYKCPALTICHAGASPDDYPLRTPNHPQEKETKSDLIQIDR